MSDDTVLKLSQPSTFSDPLTEVLRSGARSLLARAVEAEVAAFLDGHSEARTEEGRRRLVRHGHLPEREIMTGIGPVAVRAPRVRDGHRAAAVLAEVSPTTVAVGHDGGNERGAQRRGGGSASTGSSGAGACRFASDWLCASRPGAMYGVTSAISHCATLSALK